MLLLRDQLSGITDASGVITGAVFVALVLGFRRGIWASAGDAIRAALRRVRPTGSVTAPRADS